MQDKTLRVVLVDESELAQAGFATLLEPHGEQVEVVGLREAIAAPDALDVVLYEPIGLTGMLQSMLRDLRSAGSASVGVYTWTPPEDAASAAGRHVSKNLSAAALVASIQQIARGEEVEAPSTVEVAADSSGTGVDQVPDRRAVPSAAELGLTPRETEIVALITAGLTNRQIALDLELSVNSVKTYIRTAYRKIGVERRTQAVVWGLDHGLGDAPADKGASDRA